MYTLKVVVKTYNPKNFLQIQKIVQNKKNNFKFLKNLKLIQLVPLKTKKKLFTILKSPHVHKKSREQFCYKVYQRRFTIDNSNLFIILYFNFIFNNFLFSDFSITTKIKKKCL